MHFETERLELAPLTLEDAQFVFDLYSTQEFKTFVGDKNLHNLDDAKKYLETALIAMYQIKGMGLLKVTRKEDNKPVGICGLIKRDTLDDIDLGYGFLPEVFRCGYGYEAGCCMINFAKEALNITRLVAITTSNNVASRALLTKLGFTFGAIQEQQGEYTLDLSQPIYLICKPLLVKSTSQIKTKDRWDQQGDYS
ncbi:GNAT family N-acetyltransferase [Photobacterium damselae subsp. piscicida]|nr:GNAT family N-acetyltransferase [Photobacterium damselae subsp. piscicida]